MKNFTLTKKLNVSAFLFIIISLANSYSQVAKALETGNSTYIGLDAIYSSTKFKPDYGNNVFSKRMTPGINLSLGHMFNNHFGAEIGVEVDAPNNDIKHVSENDITFGVPGSNPLSIFDAYKSKINQSHLYIGAIAKSEIFDKNFISVLIGASLSRIRAKANLFGQEYIVLGFESNDITSTFNKTKAIIIGKIAFEHQINNNFSIKFLSSWKNTEKIKITAQESSNKTIKFKDSITVGVGLAYLLFS